MWTSEAPASNAAWVDSICSGGVTGTAGLSFFFGTAPVMATVMITGSGMRLILLQTRRGRANISAKRNSTFREMKKPSRRPEPSYDDLLAIVRLIESGSRFSDFRLRSGDIEVEIHRGNGADAPASAAAAPVEPKPAAANPALPPGAHVIRSPMVGTFYRAPEPGAKPFVEVGARVKRETIVCVIEVMKLMNSVPAGAEGVVTHVLVENAHRVEYGQPLIAIKPK